MNEAKLAITRLFADKSVTFGTTLDNLEEVIRHAAMLADTIRHDFGAEPIGERIEEMLGVCGS